MTVDRRSLAELRATIERRDKRIAALEAELERQKQTTVWTLDRAEQAEAEVALRDRMLVAEYDSHTPKTAGYMRWFADLRARAEGGDRGR